MRKMQFINYWQQFEHTGRVEDYLNYLQNAENGSFSDTPDTCLPDCRAEGCESLTPGRADHAGIPVCNRNRIKTDTIR